MHALYRNFKSELGQLRRVIETIDENPSVFAAGKAESFEKLNSMQNKQCCGCMRNPQHDAAKNDGYTCCTECFISAILQEYSSCGEFYKQVIAYRINEYFGGEIPQKKDLLRFLSLWEMEL